MAIPYSKEEIADTCFKKDTREYLKAWGYTDMEIQYFELWQRKGKR